MNSRVSETGSSASVVSANPRLAIDEAVRARTSESVTCHEPSASFRVLYHPIPLKMHH